MFATNDADEDSVKIPFSGTGTGPEIVIPPNLLDFGDVEIGNTEIRFLSISNIGTDTLIVHGDGVNDGPFGVDHIEAFNGPNIINNNVPLSGTFAIPSGHLLKIYFKFTPSTQGAVVDTAFLTTNDLDEGSLQIPLFGTGTPVPASIGTLITISEVFVGPNATDPKLEISLINSSEFPVGGLQCDIDLSGIEHTTLGETVEDLLVDAAPDGFQVLGNLLDEGNRLRVVVFSTGDFTIPSADQAILLARLSYTAGSTLGTEDTFGIIQESIIVSDPDGGQLSFGSHSGSVQVGIVGDVNLDSKIDVRDIVVLIAEIVGRQGFILPTDPARVHFKIQNANNEGGIDVADAVFIINQILGLPTNNAKVVAGTPVALSLGTTVTLPDGQTVLPITLVGSASIAGLQATFTFDPSLVKVGTAQAVRANQNLLIDSKVTGGQLRVVVLGLTAQGIPGNGQPILYIPVNLVEERDGALTVSALTMVNRSAQTVEVLPGVISQTITKGVTAPRAFALQSAHPNPFNPSTEIAYEVPAQAQITLAVYNLLGQEVVTLVNQVQPAGHYTVRWNARNTQGLAVSSGVYLYRLTSSTGFTSTRRMTLLK